MSVLRCSTRVGVEPAVQEQMGHAIGITATTMGGLAIGTNSWAREYHAGNAALCAMNAALAAIDDRERLETLIQQVAKTKSWQELLARPRAARRNGAKWKK